MLLSAMGCGSSKAVSVVETDIGLSGRVSPTRQPSTESGTQEISSQKIADNGQERSADTEVKKEFVKNSKEGGKDQCVQVSSCDETSDREKVGQKEIGQTHTEHDRVDYEERHAAHQPSEAVGEIVRAGSQQTFIMMMFSRMAQLS